MYECPGCGGELRFDIPTQKLICAHCDGTFEPDQYDKALFARENAYEVNVFTCPNCGGEITAVMGGCSQLSPFMLQLPRWHPLVIRVTPSSLSMVSIAASSQSAMPKPSFAAMAHAPFSSSTAWCAGS